ncbi:MAG: PDZ domain-containing protein [Solirubrobacteraceae bacterium]
MSGPRHLWAGDWQRESEAASAARADAATPPSPPDSGTEIAEPAGPSRGRIRQRLSRKRLLLAGGTVLVLAAAAFGATSLFGSSTTQNRVIAQGSGTTGTSRQPKLPSVRTTPPFGVQPPQQLNPSQPAQPSQPSQPSQPPQSSTTTVPAGPQVSWLGMQIETLPPGVAVIQTVRIGSEADRAQINPGEVIVALNGQAVKSAQDIIRLTRGMSKGRQVTLQLSYGSGSSQASVTLGRPPSVTP